MSHTTPSTPNIHPSTNMSLSALPALPVLLPLPTDSVAADNANNNNEPTTTTPSGPSPTATGFMNRDPELHQLAQPSPYYNSYALSPTAPESSVSNLWRLILRRYKAPRKPRRHLLVRTQKLETMFSENHFGIVAGVGRRVVRRDEEGEVVENERQERTVLLIEPRAGAGSEVVNGDEEVLGRWWAEMLVPRFRGMVGENWEGVAGDKKRTGMDVALVAGERVVFFYASRKGDGNGAVLERSHGKQMLDLRCVEDQVEIEGLLDGIVERAWDEDRPVLEPEVEASTSTPDLASNSDSKS